MNWRHKKEGRQASSVSLKVLRSVALGLFVLFLTTVAGQNLTDSLLLSVIVGGIVMLVDFLRDFEFSIAEFKHDSESSITEFKHDFESSTAELKGFVRETLTDFSKGAKVYDRAERSPLDTATLLRLLERVGDLDPNTPSMLLRLADLEVARLAQLLKQIIDSNEQDTRRRSGASRAPVILYDGEDREWLLALTELAQKSIDAVSLSTIDAAGASFDGGLWRSDLGNRYLDLQRDAVREKVVIRRLFYIDNPMIPKDDNDFREICQMQKSIGVDVRVLEKASVTPDLLGFISDFIIYDGQLGYEMMPAVTMENVRKPERMTTSLSRDERLAELVRRFERLWGVAVVPPWLSTTSGNPGQTGSALPGVMKP